jgi:putative transposase
MFSRRIVGWTMDERITQELALSALRMAIAARRPGPPACCTTAIAAAQYAAAHAYRRLLAGQGMPCSMSRKANCWDNAPMESFFGSLKTELDDGRGYGTRRAARNDVFGSIEGFYNCRHLHSAIGYRTPTQKEQLAAAAWAATRVHRSGERSYARRPTPK